MLSTGRINAVTTVRLYIKASLGHASVLMGTYREYSTVLYCPVTVHVSFTTILCPVPHHLTVFEIYA